MVPRPDDGPTPLLVTAHAVDGTNAAVTLLRFAAVDRHTDADDREVLLDDEPVLPEQTRDDTDRGWGEHADSNDDRLLADRPPHWE